MRFVSLVSAVAALFISSVAYAQVWDEYVNRENFFQVNFPSEPTEQQIQYKTVKGTMLPARVFTAMAPANSILRGTYRVTVVDYNNAKDELGTAMEQARAAIGAKGVRKYDEVNNMDMHRGWAMTVETPTQRILAQIIIAANSRVYITEADTDLNVPPPAQFQASLQILDNNGVRIRTRTVIAAPENEVAPVGAQANAAETAKVAAAVKGTWRNPTGGSCNAAYFKSGELTKTVRGEQALAGIVTNSGLTIPGQLILAGAREGQFVNPKDDKAIFLFENLPGDKLNFVAIGAPALGWPEATLELCPGSRG